MAVSRPATRPPTAPRSHRLPAYVYWRRRAITALALVTVLILGYLGVTLALAMTNQSYGSSMQARIAEWGRQHGLGAFVTWAEAEYYKLHPAKVGGTPGKGAFGQGGTNVTVPKSSLYLPVPSTIPTPAGTPLPGEGVWHAVGRRTANGVPGVYEAFVRPDPIHTSYVVGVAWMDPKILQAQLYSGSYIPGVGMPFKHSAPIPPIASRSLVAAFNAGFRMQDANGGYFTDNKVLIPLRTGAASVIVYKDGTMTVAKWSPSLMSNEIASVRQNLDLIVQNGKPVAGLASGNAIKWGKTLGGTFNVWRSGLGVTKDGAIVYVGGPAMSISDLANVEARAGVVTGMELDINTDWVQYATYTGPLGRAINGSTGKDMLPGMTYSPTRYFATWMNRDFYTMSLRNKFLTTLPTTTTTTAGG